MFHLKRLCFSLLFCVFSLSLVASGGCVPDEEPPLAQPPEPPVVTRSRAELVASARALAVTYQLKPIELPAAQPEPKLELGRMLFFDPILSGNKDTSCATCHRMDMALGDGLSIPAGTGAVMRDGRRLPGPAKAFMPRNVPELYNRGQASIDHFFWDGRVERLEDGRFVLHDKAEEYRPGVYLRIMPEGLDGLLAAQNMLPVLNRDELRGVAGDLDIFGEANNIALIADHDFESSWRLLFERLWAIEAYRELIRAAYPEVPESQLGYVHIANAMSAFIIDAFTFDDSPYDRFLRGDDEALDDEQLEGMTTFFGPQAKCGQCHHGPLLSDQSFHNIGVRPMTRGPDTQRGVDLGAMLRSHAGAEARFAFKTPPLRNVALSAPYFHDGMYGSLEEVIAHKNNAIERFWLFDPMSLSWEFAQQVHTSSAILEPVLETLAVQMQTPLELSMAQQASLKRFLESLTSPQARSLEGIEPETLPSELKLAHPEVR